MATNQTGNTRSEEISKARAAINEATGDGWDSSDLRHEVFQIAGSAHDNAIATCGLKNEGSDEYERVLEVSLLGLLTPRSESSEAAREWFAARGVVA
jgi:hypothetical protein